MNVLTITIGAYRTPSMRDYAGSMDGQRGCADQLAVPDLLVSTIRDGRQA
jgi:hypothetical protein